MPTPKRNGARSGWHIVEDAARGYRRVVPSPEPLEIVELDVIRDLVDHGVLVVCTGGGGIPVVRVDGGLQGVESGDRQGPRLGAAGGAAGVDLFAISTDTDYVYLNYKKPDQTPLTSVTVSQLRALPSRRDIFRPATWDRRSSRSLSSCAAGAGKR